jgi:hypothetical protein
MDEKVKKIKEMLGISIFEECCQGKLCRDDHTFSRAFVDKLLEITLEQPLNSSMLNLKNKGHMCFVKNRNHYELNCNDYEIEIYFKGEVQLPAEVIHFLLLDFIHFMKSELLLDINVKSLLPVWFLDTNDYLQVIVKT